MSIKSKPHLIAQHLKESILSGKFKQGSKLPSLLKLVKALNVNKKTIIKAYKLLEKEKILSRCPRSGVYVNAPDVINASGKNTGSPGNVFARIAPNTSIEEKITEAIIDKIVSGFYKKGEFLPQNKTLVAEFKTTRKTVLAVLNRLCGRNFISKYGRSYKIDLPVVNMSDSKKTIFLAGYSSYISQRAITANKEFFSSFENEIAAAGRVFLKVFAEEDTLKQIEGCNLNENMLGFLYFGNWDDMQKDINALTGTKKPVVLYDNNYTDYTFKDTARIFKFEKNDCDSGESVAKHLAVFGHKNTAYFCAFNEKPWSNKRLTGLHSGFRKIYGTEYTIATYFYNQTDINFPDNFFAKLQKQFSHLDVAGYKFTDIDPISLNLLNHEPNIYSVAQTHVALVNAIRKDSMIRIMRPHFENALKNESITAWVCSNETLASVAFDFLGEKGVPVPDKISLAGFDNNEDCMIKRISTYDFGKSRMGYLAAHCLLGDIPVKKDRNGQVKCEGNFIMRQTLGKAAG